LGMSGLEGTTQIWASDLSKRYDRVARDCQNDNVFRVFNSVSWCFFTVELAASYKNCKSADFT
jgi:hypothetical protein